MRLACFVYDFSHQKSLAGLKVLADNGLDVGCVIAAPWRSLSTHSPSGPPDDALILQARTLARRQGYPWISTAHGSQESIDVLARHRCDLGIILGARILPRGIRALLPGGLLNLHPGLLPWNRGLDCVKWAVEHNLPQGFTAHLVSDVVDHGPLLMRTMLGTLPDCPMDGIRPHLDALSLRNLPVVITQVSAGDAKAMEPPGDYHSRMPAHIDSAVRERFPEYALEYERLIESWADRGLMVM